MNVILVAPGIHQRPMGTNLKMNTGGRPPPAVVPRRRDLVPRGRDLGASKLVSATVAINVAAALHRKGAYTLGITTFLKGEIFK